MQQLLEEYKNITLEKNKHIACLKQETCQNWNSEFLEDTNMVQEFIDVLEKREFILSKDLNTLKHGIDLQLILDEAKKFDRDRHTYLLSKLRKINACTLKLHRLREALQLSTKNKYKNLSSLLGDDLAADLFLVVGEFQELFKLQSSNIRNLKAQPNSPVGILYKHRLVKKLSESIKPKVVRVLANKVALATKLDFSKCDYFPDLYTDVQKAAERYMMEINKDNSVSSVPKILRKTRRGGRKAKSRRKKIKAFNKEDVNAEEDSSMS